LSGSCTRTSTHGDASACSAAAEFGHFDIFEVPSRAGLPVELSDVQPGRRFRRQARAGLSARAGCPWDATACANAALHRELDALVFLHEHGCPWDKETIVNAACAGDLDSVQYAHTRGCPLSPEAYKMATDRKYADAYLDRHARECGGNAHKGRIRVAAYLEENGCPKSDWVRVSVVNGLCVK